MIKLYLKRITSFKCVRFFLPSSRLSREEGHGLPGCYVDEGDLSSRQLKRVEALEIKLNEQISLKSILILLKINQSCQLKA